VFLALLEPLAILVTGALMRLVMLANLLPIVESNQRVR
jgi:type II secretory pathway component PulF